MVETLFDETASLIKRWVPNEYEKVKHYRDDLLEFLRNEFHKPSPLGLPQKVTVYDETGIGRCDIAVNTIGIVTRKDLETVSQADTLSRQLNAYERIYRDMILVLIGNINPSALERLRFDLHRRESRMNIFNQQQYTIIVKS